MPLRRLLLQVTPLPAVAVLHEVGLLSEGLHVVSHASGFTLQLLPTWLQLVLIPIEQPFVLCRCILPA